jgi:L,D-peptidoglycan transpeptidase YkuD (ErfK/YbiS/YcfS/YnhG family)
VYDLIGVLGWNDAPVVKGRGSAIFLHVARWDYAPTEGCVALALPDLSRLLAEGMTALRVQAGP